MADYMANVAMDTKSSKTLDHTSVGIEKARFRQVQHWLVNYLQGEPTTRRTSLIRKFQDF